MDMSPRGARRATKNAGAFLSPVGTIPTPMHTLSEDYADRPTYPEDEHVPEPGPPSLVRRLLDRLLRRSLAVATRLPNSSQPDRQGASGSLHPWSDMWALWALARR